MSDEALVDAAAEAALPSPATSKTQGSEEEQEWLSRERRPSTSARRDSAEKGRNPQPGEDTNALECRLGAIRKTHGAILEGIEAAQGNVVKMMKGAKQKSSPGRYKH
ncbi:hypothetical protein Esti_006624 [Eimeria stiedai]